VTSTGSEVKVILNRIIRAGNDFVKAECDVKGEE
jgi:hypothetical protein